MLYGLLAHWELAYWVLCDSLARLLYLWCGKFCFQTPVFTTSNHCFIALKISYTDEKRSNLATKCEESIQKKEKRNYCYLEGIEAIIIDHDTALHKSNQHHPALKGPYDDRKAVFDEDEESNKTKAIIIENGSENPENDETLSSRSTENGQDNIDLGCGDYANEGYFIATQVSDREEESIVKLTTTKEEDHEQVSDDDDDDDDDDEGDIKLNQDQVRRQKQFSKEEIEQDKQSYGRDRVREHGERDQNHNMSIGITYTVQEEKCLGIVQQSTENEPVVPSVYQIGKREIENDGMMQILQTQHKALTTTTFPQVASDAYLAKLEKQQAISYNADYSAIQELRDCAVASHCGKANPESERPSAYHYSRSPPALSLQIFKIEVWATKQFNKFSARMKTFRSYENKWMPATQLAKAGFISGRRGDHVLCLWCLLILKDFTEPVDALAVHQLHSLNHCEYLKKTTRLEFHNPALLFPIYDLGKHGLVVTSCLHN